MRGRNRAACLLAVFTLASLSACGKKDAPVVAPAAPAETSEEAAPAREEVERPPKGNKPELVIGLAKDITALNPMTSTDAVNDHVLALTHETLFTKTADGAIEPLLAIGGEWTDETTYDLMLRSGVRFTNGAPLTAEDVVHTFDTARGLHHGAIAPLLTDIESVEALAENRVAFHTTVRMDDIEERLSSPVFAIQSKAAYDTGMQNPYLIGTGRYAFVDRVNGRYTSFKKNEDYWGDEGASSRISFYAYPSEEDRVNAIKSGTADIVLLSKETAATALTDEDGVLVFETDEGALAYRENAVFPAFYESAVQPWADVYVVLE